MHRTILIAEDNPEDAFLLRRAFTAAAIKVRMNFVQDGQEAINYLQGCGGFTDRTAHPFPELLLLDLKMPRLDGFDVLAWMRDQPGLKRLPVAVLTSSSHARDVNRAYDLGANSYLVKPSQSEDLRQLVARLNEYWLEFNQSPDCSNLTEGTTECGE